VSFRRSNSRKQANPRVHSKQAKPDSHRFVPPHALSIASLASSADYSVTTPTNAQTNAFRLLREGIRSLRRAKRSFSRCNNSNLFNSRASANQDCFSNNRSNSSSKDQGCFLLSNSSMNREQTLSINSDVL